MKISKQLEMDSLLSTTFFQVHKNGKFIEVGMKSSQVKPDYFLSHKVKTKYV